MNLFQHKILKKHIATESEKIKNAFGKFADYFHNEKIQENIRNSKEEQFQEGFLRELFVKILGYTLNPAPNYNLITEQKNETNSKKADGAILIDGEVVGIIELKDTKTTDLKTVESQAFGYKNYNKKASYVIISNFEKLRFYIDNAVEFVEFNLFTLTLDEFSVLWLCLAQENIVKDLPKQLKSESVGKEEQITKELYKNYSRFKRELFADLTTNNPQYDRILLFRKSQKLLDRLLFILFAEDRNLLPPNSIAEIIEQWEKLKDLDEYRPLYERYKKYFGYMNTGFKGKKHDIFAYNGGLFKPDEVLDNVIIADEVLRDNSLRLSQYDFDSEVDVNILGHIFENSLTEIEEISQSITKGETTAPTGKRKKDGVFYTPRYITTYMVENTIGRLCAEKKAELEIDESEYAADKKRQKTTKTKLADKLQAYRAWLLSVTICDPACGSGAFLNAALEFLIREHRLLDELNAKLFGDAIVFADIENAILEKNLYGVDINEESVEIAKLSLWLRTAKPHRKLNVLSNNIKCGNSLIADPEVAGDKAFDWRKEFPKVFEKGGFDVVIGNPPYVDIKQLDNEIVKYLFKNYKTAENRINLYSIFIEKGYELLRNKGILSFINPNSMLMNSSYSKLRNLIIDDLNEIIKLPDNVFQDATVETIIFIVRKNSNSQNINTLIYRKNDTISFIEKEKAEIVEKHQWRLSKELTFNIFASQKQIAILNKIKGKNCLLGDIADFSLGITPYDKYKGHSEETIKSKAFHAPNKIDETYKPLIAGENIVRYVVSDKIKEYIKYGNWLGAPREERFFINPRIIVRQIVSGNPPRIYAGYTNESLYFTQIGFAIIPEESIDVKYLLTLLNSKLINFFHTFTFLDLEKELFQKILIANCKCFPIPKISLSDQQPFINKADQMLSLNTELQAKRQRFLGRLKDNFDNLKITGALEKFDESDFKTFLSELKKQKIALSLRQQDEWDAYFNDYKTECNQLSAQIAETDKTIDMMVYALYGLTEEEIGIVEK